MRSEIELDTDPVTPAMKSVDEWVASEIARIQSVQEEEYRRQGRFVQCPETHEEIPTGPKSPDRLGDRVVGQSKSVGELLSLPPAPPFRVRVDTYEGRSPGWELVLELVENGRRKTRRYDGVTGTPSRGWEVADYPQSKPWLD